MPLFFLLMIPAEHCDYLHLIKYSILLYFVYFLKSFSNSFYFSLVIKIIMNFLINLMN